MQPAWGSLLLLAFPSFTETPLLPPSSELQASLPASLRQDRERQACYRLVLSPQRLPLITSWGGQQRAARTPSRTVFLRKATGPAAHTGASSGRHLPLHWPRQILPISRAGRKGFQSITHLHFTVMKETVSLLKRFSLLTLGIVGRQGEKLVVVF